ncbi:hypothetical protein QTP86_029522 [Hemibagrus guttatus]|nr:hypothetical protein QTP86_029522 [Hemibagrus guttatus]
MYLFVQGPIGRPGISGPAGPKGEQWLALFPHTSRVGGSIPASAVCVEFACSPRALGVSSGYSGFLPQSKDMHGRLIGISKLSVVCDCVSE